jgi:hypothetical protein
LLTRNHRGRSAAGAPPVARGRAHRQQLAHAGGDGRLRVVLGVEREEEVADPEREAVDHHRAVRRARRLGRGEAVRQVGRQRERRLERVPARGPLAAVGGDAAGHVVVERLRGGHEQHAVAARPLGERDRAVALAGAHAAEDEGQAGRAGRAGGGPRGRVRAHGRRARAGRACG